MNSYKGASHRSECA